MVKNPCQHARRAGLAVGARYRKDPLVAQNMSPQPLGTGRVMQPLIEHCFHNRLAPGQSISDHNTIRRRIKLLRPVPVDQVNPTFRQLCAHRRVDIAIRPRDAETGLSRQ